MLTGLLLLMFWLAKWSFRVPDEWCFLLFVPLAALLCSDIQLGYRVYLLKDIDYVFYHPLGLFAALILSLPFWQYLPVGGKVRQWTATAWVPLVAAVFYYPFGIYALLAAVLVAIHNSQFIIHNKGGAKLFTLHFSLFTLLVLTLWLVPLLETAGTTMMRPDQPWLYGFRRFEPDALRDVSLEMPFYVVLVAPVFFPFLEKLKGKTGLFLSQSVMAAVAAAMFYGLSARDFTDYNFHAEMRMQRGVEECRWGDVLREAAKAKGPVTREMVMLRDIALINRGEFCSMRYRYRNESIPPATVGDRVHIRISNQAADLIYLNFGETVFAIRRAMERCMHYGYSYYTMRMLAECAVVNGELDNARKYLRILSLTTFQKKWAERMLRLVRDERLLAESEPFRMPLKLYNEGSELVGTDDNYVELTIMKKWMYTITNDPVAQEVALGCAMIMRDRNCFWSQVQQHYNINPNQPFPTHVQEAMLFDVYELGMQGVNLSFVKFDERVLERYQAFISRLRQYESQGMDVREASVALQPEFGDTFMWDYYANRQVQTN